MSNLEYATDLLIVDGDVVLENDAEVMVTGLACLQQDIKHMVLASQELHQCIGERDPDARTGHYLRLQSIIEDDSRMKIGTVQVFEQKNTADVIWITGDSLLGQLSINLSTQETNP